MSQQGAPMPVRVGILRLTMGETAQVLCLSPGVGPEKDRVGGTFGHYKGRWQPCIVGNCPAALHSTQRFWRGYIAAFVFSKAARRWEPCVLEVSESLELDMRGRYSPGQVWEISRAKGNGKKELPYVGRLCPKQPQLEATRAFDLVPILEAFYHCGPLDLSQASEQPSRTYLLPLPVGETVPDPTAPPSSTPATAEQREQLLKRLNGTLAMKGGG